MNDMTSSSQRRAARTPLTMRCAGAAGPIIAPPTGRLAARGRALRWLVAGAFAVVASGAGSSDPRESSWDDRAAGIRLVAVHTEPLAPGEVTYKRYRVQRAAGAEGGSFAFVLVGLRDFDAGCNEPERAAGDTTCGPRAGAGELSTQLVVRSTWAVADPACPGEGRIGNAVPLSDAEGVVVTAPQAVSDADAACVVLALELPASADNRVQSDEVHFGIELGVVDASSVRAPSVLAIPDSLPFGDSGAGDTRSGGDAALQDSKAFAYHHLAAVLSALVAMLLVAGAVFASRRPATSGETPSSR
jgi:hypothetical protein